jgi:hypothetical protein
MRIGHSRSGEELVAIPDEIEDLQVRLEAQKPPGQFVSVHVGHDHVGQQQIEGILGFRDPECLGTIGRHRRLVPGAVEYTLDKRANGFFIVHDEHARRRLHLL